MAIVSKAVFDKEARVDGSTVGLGAVWPVDRYNTNNKILQGALEGGGRVFLVTVRPPDEKLWLVAVIESPKLKGSSWVAAQKNTVAVTDISSLRKTIVFESGKGMSQDKGSLGMSLQTPRVLAAADVEKIMAVIGGGGAVASAPAKPPSAHAALLAEIAAKPNDELVRERVVRELVKLGALQDVREALSGVAHLNAHDEAGLPCLCKQCWETTSETHEMGGVTFKRDVVVKGKHALFYWAPIELDARAVALRNSVRSSLGLRLQKLAQNRKRNARAMPQF